MLVLSAHANIAAILRKFNSKVRLEDAFRFSLINSNIDIYMRVSMQSLSRLGIIISGNLSGEKF